MEGALAAIVRENARTDEVWSDDIAEILAIFALSDGIHFDEHLLDGAKKILIDTIAVALGAFHHPAAASARRYLDFFPADPTGVAIWGASRKATPDKATLVNGVLLRCYDYNDVMIGRLGAGHPSDMIAALISLCDWRDIGGRQLLEAIVIGYEVAEALHEITPAEAAGWDHANVSALAATCALGRLMQLPHEQMREALGIAAIEHVQSNEIESSALNQRGDLTMWKRFHGADAMRHALDSCLLAAAGAEGPVRPFRGKLGFLNIFGIKDDPAPYLAEKLAFGRCSGAVHRTNFKRWPVGSRAQSAIASALDAYRQAQGAPITKVHVRTEADVYQHLVAIRQDPWHPVSRETADHSLPYIVGAATLDGYINVGSFDLDKVLDPARAEFIARCVTVELATDIVGVRNGHNLSQVEATAADGRRLIGLCAAAPGHKANPFSHADLRDKLHENSDLLFGKVRSAQIFDIISGLENTSVKQFTHYLMKD
jgi:2-methylcitrate dehydratase